MGSEFPMELTLLGVAVIIGIVQLLWGAAAARAGGQDLKWAAGSRDEPRPVGVVAARLDRALKNFQETFPLFAAAVLAAVMAEKLGTLTLWGSWLYVVGRALYVPIYAAGTSGLRSLVWFVAIIGLLMVTASLFIA